jgi:tRNA(Ile)-lysidine synthetase, N-terminal domain/tRNA(Ile)-lysidine synthetase, C-terminal domain
MIVQRVLNYVKVHKLIEKKEHIIVGVSGGVDSICLLFMLKELQSSMPFKISVVHVEHGIRGVESKEDAAFVEKICKENQIHFSQYSYDIRQLAKQEGLSIEAAGRKARYESFFNECNKLGGTKVAVAHHTNDQAETILWNMVRGTGAKGFGGMEPYKEMEYPVIRPLLCVSRRDIEVYLKQNRLSYREDETNGELIYTRNKIRHKLLPYMEQELNINAVYHITALGQNILEMNQFIEQIALYKYRDMVEENESKVRIALDKFLTEEHIIQTYIVRQALQYCSRSLKDIGSIHIEQIISLASLQVGKEAYLPGKILGKREYGSICLGLERNKEQPVEELEKEIRQTVIVPGELKFLNYNFVFSKTRKENQKNIQKKYTICLDYDKIKFSLELRTRKSGDYITIHSQGKRKKLKAFFIDEKIARELRNKIPLLCIGEEIIWIVGYRINEKYKVTDETKTILEIQVYEKN